jgi:diguanylate cyclase (GGDEF)-like protein
MLIDIDHFKRNNDSYGHPVGDEVLRSVASCLANLPRRGDFVGRYGGEEFAVVTRRTGRDVAQSIGDRFRQSVARMDLPETVPVRKVTVSIGISVWPDGRETSAAAGTGSGAGVLERLIKEADEALYAAKEGGRDRVVVAPYSGRSGTDDAPAPG